MEKRLLDSGSHERLSNFSKSKSRLRLVKAVQGGPRKIPCQAVYEAVERPLFPAALIILASPQRADNPVAKGQFPGSVG